MIPKIEDGNNFGVSIQVRKWILFDRGTRVIPPVVSVGVKGVNLSFCGNKISKGNKTFIL